MKIDCRNRAKYFFTCRGSYQLVTRRGKKLREHDVQGLGESAKVGSGWLRVSPPLLRRRRSETISSPHYHKYSVSSILHVQVDISFYTEKWIFSSEVSLLFSLCILMKLLVIQIENIKYSEYLPLYCYYNYTPCYSMYRIFTTLCHWQYNQL